MKGHAQLTVTLNLKVNHKIWSKYLIIFEILDLENVQNVSKIISVT